MNSIRKFGLNNQIALLAKQYPEAERIEIAVRDRYLRLLGNIE